LDLIDYNESSERGQPSHRLGEAPQIERVLEIEITWRVGLKVLASEGGLAYLPRPDQSHGRAAPKSRGNRRRELNTSDIGRHRQRLP
jgi:hypothetical protein